MPEEGICKQSHADILRFEEMLVVAAAAIDCGVEQIRITGGEPLVRKGVVGFIKDLAGIKGLKDLCLTTNASRLQELAPQLKAAGLRRVNISLDSLDPQNFKKITRNGNLEEVLNGIQAALENDLRPVKLNVVLIPGVNDHEIEDFVNFARKKPVTVRFIERMPFTSGVANDSNEAYVSEAAVLEKLKKLCNLTNVADPDTFGPAKSFSIENGAGKIGFISPRTRPFCEVCRRLRLTADGFLLPCLDSSYGVQIRNKSHEEVATVIKQLYDEKASWSKNRACFGGSFASSLAKIGG
jgi:cyclic pyranopterin phosphate synthase